MARLVSERLLRAADRLAEGRRETPQRLIPLAYRAARRPGCAAALLEFLLAETSAESEQGADADAISLLSHRAAKAVAAGETAPPQMLAELLAEVDTLAPRRRWRRSIHCHGQITTDRRLLVLRTVLRLWIGRRDGYAPFWLWHALAYAVFDYDHDHFEMIGPAVERRMRRLADWVAARPGLDRGGEPAR